MRSVYDVIIKPVISEKSMDQAPGKKYTFKVAVDANKTEVKHDQGRLEERRREDDLGRWHLLAGSGHG